MRLLIIDNYDSFTFNLYQLAAEVFQVIPEVVKNDAPWALIADRHFDAAIISPGPGRPERPKDFGISHRLLTEKRIPILGVCLGHQGIWSAFGGRISHAPEPMHGRVSPILHNGDGLFVNLPSPFRSVRYHSLLCDGTPPEALIETAWTEDGVIMGVAHRTRPLWGVQFHPESISTQYGFELLRNFQRLAVPSITTLATPDRVVGRASWPVHPSETRTAPISGGRSLSVRKSQITMPDDEVFARLFGKCPYSFWLDGSDSGAASARFSFMGGYSETEVSFLKYSVADAALECRRLTTDDSATKRDPLDLIAALLDEMPGQTDELPFDFATGFVGYFGYEMKDLLGSPSRHTASTPDCYVLRVDRFVAIDHVSKEIYMVFGADTASAGSADAWFEALATKLSDPSLSPNLGSVDPSAVAFSLADSKDDYLNRIEVCKQNIRDGESYEICLTNKLRSAAPGIEPFEYYRALRRRNPAPYSAYLRFPELAVACSSPERFLKISRDGAIESKPLKGTSARSPFPDIDMVLRNNLEHSEKARSEHLMIVDLIRNDLGRVCSIGSVHVPSLMNIETYATVHQMVSTISGRLAAGQKAMDCFRACFPGGSMTGAPKLRTMSIIDSLETEARGVYSGSIGYLSANGAADLNIVIRTAVFNRGEVTVGVGGAIVALSDPAEEWEEALLKSKALVDAFRAESGRPGTGAL